MKFKTFCMLGLFGACAVLSAGDLQIKSVKSTGLKNEALLDKSVADSSFWRAKGEKHNIEFIFAAPEKIANVRIYPGVRGYAALPSTESGPREIAIFGRQGNKYIPLTDKISLPRDPQSGKDFLVNIPVKEELVSSIKIEIYSSHDRGNRLNSKKIAPPEKRSVYIREVDFQTSAMKAAEVAANLKKFAAAADFLKNYKTLLARKDTVATAVSNAWGERMVQLEKLITAGVESELIARNHEYLAKQITPYFNISKINVNGQNPILNVSVANGTKTGVPVDFPLHFSMLEEIFGKKISYFNVSVQAVKADGSAFDVVRSLYPLTPNRSKLAWNTVEDAESYNIIFAPYSEGEKPKFNSLIGNGDHLMLNKNSRTTLPWRIWNIRFADIFNEGKNAFTNGSWIDYAHVYRNLGTKENPQYHESAHYLVLDSFDNPVGTTEHHGLAFSLMESADFDGDGKLDVSLQRTYDGIPLYMHNISKAKGLLDFADPVDLQTLIGGLRYTYADLNGDKLADAIGSQMTKGKMSIYYFQSIGYDSNGVPSFASKQKLDLVLPESKETSRDYHAYKPVCTLLDLNNDGLTDMGISIPPYVYVCFNEGDAKNFKFKTLHMVKHENGQPYRNDFYYPNICWGDINGDGIHDLFNKSPSQYYASKGDVLTIANKGTSFARLEKQTELSDVFAGLAHFQFVDFDHDGKLEFLQINNNYGLSVFRFENGLMHKIGSFPLEPADWERYGCMDHTEYNQFYSQILAYDFDGDGKEDILLNSEHNFTFGYFSLYLNKGDFKLSKEFQVTPKLDRKHLKTVKSPAGKALVVNPESNLDFISFETKGLLDRQGGMIEFTFASDCDKAPENGRTLFSSTFWDRKALDNKELYETYRNAKNVADFLKTNPGFALVQLPDGKLRCQFGKKYAESASPVKLAKNVYHKFTVTWDGKKVALSMDDKVIAENNGQIEHIAERFHIGSMASLALQHHREYNSRIKSHPYDISAAACGYFEDLNLYNAQGEKTLAVDFENNFGPIEKRSELAYRCNPAVVENFNGKTVLISHFDNCCRTNDENFPVQQLYAVPFTREIGKAPVFGEAIPLYMTDGKPFYAHTRTNISIIDWNKDGHKDIILATENCGDNPYNIGLDLFINDGSWKFTRTKDPEIKKVIDLMTGHHDVKLQFVNLTGGADPDFVTWTDPGIRVYSRNFLREKSPEIKINSISAK